MEGGRIKHKWLHDLCNSHTIMSLMQQQQLGQWYSTVRVLLALVHTCSTIGTTRAACTRLRGCCSVFRAALLGYAACVSLKTMLAASECPCAV